MDSEGLAWDVSKVNRDGGHSCDIVQGEAACILFVFYEGLSLKVID